MRDRFLIQQPRKDLIGRLFRLKETIIFSPSTTKSPVNKATESVDDTFATTGYDKFDYEFYDQLYKAESESSMAFGGMLVRPIIGIHSSYTLSDGFTVIPDTVAEGDSGALAELGKRLNSIFSRNLDKLELADRTAKRFGKSFLGINTAGIMEVLHPAKVKYGYKDSDPTVITYLEKINKHTVWDDDSGEWVEAEDKLVYTREKITYTRLLKKQSGDEETSLEEVNVWGLIPYVEISHFDSVNDKIGYPLAYPLLAALKLYHQIFVRSGAAILYFANPTMVIKGVGNVQKWLEQNFGGIGTDESGKTSETTGTLEQFNALISNNTDFEVSFLIPDKVNVDSMSFLKKLFLLVLENTDTPEFLMGTQMEGSNATVREQWASFVGAVKSVRALIWNPAIRRLCQIFMVVYANEIRDPLNPDDPVNGVYPALLDTTRTIEEITTNFVMSIKWPTILPRQIEIDEVVLQNLSELKILAPVDRLKAVEHLFDNVEEVIRRGMEFWGEEFGKGQASMDKQAFGSPKDQRDKENQDRDKSNSGQGTRGAK